MGDETRAAGKGIADRRLYKMGDTFKAPLSIEFTNTTINFVFLIFLDGSASFVTRGCL
jgi:hypothetical protein